MGCSVTWCERRFGGRARALSVLLFAVIAWIGFRPALAPITPGLDPSHAYGFNAAAVSGLRWGVQFVWTYGPYGYLLHTMDLDDLFLQRIAAEVVFAILSGVAIMLYVRFADPGNAATRAACVMLLGLMLNLGPPEERWLGLVVLYAVGGIHWPSRLGLASHALAGLLSGLALLMKFSVGFAGVLAVASTAVIANGARCMAIRLAVGVSAMAAAVVVGWFASGQQPGDLGAYFATGWEMSRGYSSAMSWVSDSPSTTAVATSYGLFVAMLTIAVLRPEGRRARLSFLGLSAPLFVAWKHSMVRQDPTHVGFFLSSGLLALAILLTDSISATGWLRAGTLALLLLIPLGAPWVAASAGPDGLTGPFVTLGRAAQAVVLSEDKFAVVLGRVAAYRREIGRVTRTALADRFLPVHVRR
jgi:hypothetical protein